MLKATLLGINFQNSVHLLRGERGSKKPMITKRIATRIAALAITVVFAIGAFAPIGSAQYGNPYSGTVTPNSSLSAAAQKAANKKCKAKAKKKKGKARAKALKKCKKKAKKRAKK